jgi:hypothetical protein
MMAAIKDVSNRLSVPEFLMIIRKAATQSTLVAIYLLILTAKAKGNVRQAGGT